MVDGLRPWVFSETRQDMVGHEVRVEDGRTPDCCFKTKHEAAVERSASESYSMGRTVYLSLEHGSSRRSDVSSCPENGKSTCRRLSTVRAGLTQLD